MGNLTRGPGVAEKKNEPKARFFVAVTLGPRAEFPAPMSVVVCFSSKNVHMR